MGNSGNLSSEDNFEPVFTLLNLAELPAAKSALEAAGIPYFVENEFSASIYRGGEGMRILVPASRRDDAAEILEAIFGESPPPEISGDCGAEGRMRVLLAKLTAIGRVCLYAAAFVVIGVIALFTPDIYKKLAADRRLRAETISEARNLGITYGEVFLQPADYVGKPVYWLLKPHVNAWYYDGDWKKPVIFENGPAPYPKSYPQKFAAFVVGRNEYGMIVLKSVR
jgi:hypothetical protein